MNYHETKASLVPKLRLPLILVYSALFQNGLKEKVPLLWLLMCAPVTFYRWFQRRGTTPMLSIAVLKLRNGKALFQIQCRR